MTDKAPSVYSFFVRLNHFDDVVQECQGSLDDNEGGQTYTRKKPQRKSCRREILELTSKQIKKTRIRSIICPAAYPKAAANAPPS